MFAGGFIFVAVALYLLDSAVKNRNPITTLRDIITDPANTRSTLDSSAGTGFQSTATSVGSQASTGGTTGASGATSIPSGGDTISRVIAFASQQIGKPYGWGTPNRATWKPGQPIKSADCSGLIWAAYKTAGVNIPSVTATQIVGGKRVARKDLQPGDLIFPYPGHVFLYIGGGRCIEAPHTGSVVHYTTIYQFMTARRYV